MKKISLLIILAVASLLAWVLLINKKKPKDETSKQQPVMVSKYSPAFITSVNNTLASYYTLSEALVNWDTAAVSKWGKALSHDLDSLNFEELSKDTIIYETATSYISTFRNDLETITSGTDVAKKRTAFNSFSQNLYDLLRTVKFDGGKIYLEECPMAFNNETEAGLWLSKTDAIRNPYLGLHHPKYKGSMLDCGSVKDTLNFTAGEKL